MNGLCDGYKNIYKKNNNNEGLTILGWKAAKLKGTTVQERRLIVEVLWVYGMHFHFFKYYGILSS